MTCPSCGHENLEGQKFCGECGTPLQAACPSCGAQNAPGQKFCGECGEALAAQPGQATPPSAPAAERRLVSVLFADLVGFTAASESRDSEDTRELLSRYFETARTIIGRYGGTVEKFIGDAVMAVWGAPTAQEDDAERAVRAALDLIGAIPELDPSLQARSGVVTGEAAVTVGAEGQGMVAGDLVNTASRIQSVAEPGTVLVGAATRRASEAAIVYEDAGEHELKGKAEPLQLWRALRVVAARKGEGRSAGLEAPFVGREREFRLVKDLFHATADEGRAHLLSIVAVPGMGKSRLAWEFEKYIDGLAETAWWHKGRCLAYGEGVAYWALAEMVRMRARIAEDEPAEQSLPKLSSVLEGIVTDPEERAFVEPRLQQLLGLTERVAPDREDLFSAWRLFVERMADQFPVLMVFEDVHWADAALIEFIEYLLDWSRAYPIYVIALARPEVSERHPGWGTKVRNFTSLTLEPLPEDAIDSLLRGLVPGLPDEAVTRIRDRADGIPLYAVETVRMLIDRGLLETAESGYAVTGDLAALDVPETLHALIAARLDGLGPAERQLLQDAAVLGKTFTPRGLAALSGASEGTLGPHLASLVRKEMLLLDTDPRSPERGQYGFVQALVQRVAYETLSRRDRKTKHLAAAAFLSGDSGIDADEIAEVIATHLLDAHRAAPDDDDAVEIKSSARDWLTRAAERSAALAATEDAQRAFESAVELADEPLERARLLERAGEVARMADRLEDAERHLRAAFALCDETGATHDRARVAAALGQAVWQQGRIEDAIELMEGAYTVLAADERDADVATLAAQLGRLHYFAENRRLAAERIEVALDIAEELGLPSVLASALNTKSLVLSTRRHEADALLRQALRIALDHDLVFEALRAYNNLLVKLDAFDRPEEIEPLLNEALSLARRRGDRFWELRLVASLAEEYRYLGRWEEAEELFESLPRRESAGDPILMASVLGLVRIMIDRGNRARAKELLPPVAAVDESDFQLRMLAIRRKHLEAELDGRLDDAAQLVLEVIPISLEASSQTTSEALADAARYAAETRDAAAARTAVSLIGHLPVSARPRLTESQAHRLLGLAAAIEGDEDAAATAFGIALANARSVNYPYFLAPVLRDYGAWLVACGRGDEAAPLLAEARALFEKMGATAWLERIESLGEISLAASRT
jgi:class 3 adenylate cyclase/tetratricopeptide (TPR) repeat protein